MRVRSASGILRKKSKFSRSASRIGSCGSMLIALRFGEALSFTGQTCTQSVQPVQSSGATWSVYFFPAKSCERKSADLNVAARRRAARRRRIFGRMQACGRRARTCCTGCRSTRSRPNFLRDVALLPFRGAGRPGAIDREGAHGQQVALAGEHHSGDALHEVGRGLGHGRRGGRAMISPVGILISCRPASVRSTAAKFRCTTSSPLRP